ncbi:unnamed protein product [Cercopithifilaria johnstoni]|uniref:Uncharacterized protein n=1 Tax=Cercopithifilaria johnstoni TaxID=2874296 RepID=A0A8J2Q3G7_9BILA|nr:unnamed protein product [Cercopithifilaria johnstoni]
MQNKGRKRKRMCIISSYVLMKRGKCKPALTTFSYDDDVSMEDSGLAKRRGTFVSPLTPYTPPHNLRNQQ